jgi:hypothetical protein
MMRWVNTPWAVIHSSFIIVRRKWAWWKTGNIKGATMKIYLHMIGVLIVSVFGFSALAQDATNQLEQPVSNNNATSKIENVASNSRGTGRRNVEGRPRDIRDSKNRDVEGRPRDIHDTTGRDVEGRPIDIGTSTNNILKPTN